MFCWRFQRWAGHERWGGTVGPAPPPSIDVFIRTSPDFCNNQKAFSTGFSPHNIQSSSETTIGGRLPSKKSLMAFWDKTVQNCWLITEGWYQLGDGVERYIQYTIHVWWYSQTYRMDCEGIHSSKLVMVFTFHSRTTHSIGIHGHKWDLKVVSAQMDCDCKVVKRAVMVPIHSL